MEAINNVVESFFDCFFDGQKKKNPNYKLFAKLKLNVCRKQEMIKILGTFKHLIFLPIH